LSALSVEAFYPQTDEHPVQTDIICKLTEGALNPLVEVIDKGFKNSWPQC